MKRLIAILCCLALLLGCTACGLLGDSSGTTSGGKTSFTPGGASSGTSSGSENEDTEHLPNEERGDDETPGTGGSTSGGLFPQGQPTDDPEPSLPNEEQGDPAPQTGEGTGTGTGSGGETPSGGGSTGGSTGGSGTSGGSSGSSTGGGASSGSQQTAPATGKVTGNYIPAGERHYPIYYVKTSEKKIAISFDSGFEEGFTYELLDILAQYGVTCTFFVTGLFATNFPERVKAMAAAGHEVMSHSYNHPSFLSLTVEEMLKELNDTNDVVEKLTGVRPTLIRLPYGDWRYTGEPVRNDVVDTVRSIGMEPIQWSIDSLDWKESLTADEVYHRIIDNLHPGAIILCHNAGMTEPEILANVLSYAQSQGYTFVPVSELLIHGDYTIDGNGMMKPAS